MADRLKVPGPRGVVPGADRDIVDRVFGNAQAERPMPTAVESFQAIFDAAQRHKLRRGQSRAEHQAAGTRRARAVASGTVGPAGEQFPTSTEPTLDRQDAPAFLPNDLFT
jgi:hypothetical protein